MMRLEKLMTLLLVLGMTAKLAVADPKAKPAEKSEAAAPAQTAPATPADQTKADAPATTETQAIAGPPVVKRVDPVEAALAQAMALSRAPVAEPAKAAVKSGKRRDRGLKGLHKFTRSAGKININAWTHSTKVPVHEPVVRMDTQSLSASEVTAVIKKNLRKIQYCHERLAARGPAPSGEVAVRFTILPKGNPVEIEVTAGGANAQALERCMAERIRRIAFPAADAPTEVSYPFVFDVAGTAVEGVAQ